MGTRTQISDKEKAANIAANSMVTYDGNHRHTNQDLSQLQQLEQADISMKSLAKKQQYLLGSNAQESRVLDYLMTNQHKGINRYEADFGLNVCHVSARINSLRNKGHDITTVYENANDLNGRMHKKIARYYWRGFDYCHDDNSVSV